MWFEGLGDVLEMFRNSFPTSLLFFIPLFVIISPGSPVSAAHEFAVHRMQQFDLQGSVYGSRNTLVNVEARSIDSKSLIRRCPVVKFKELTIDKFKNAASQNAGGILVILPNDMHKMTEKDTKLLMDLEQDLLSEETSVPVYFAEESPELQEVYEDVTTSVNSDQASSAAEAMFSSASANGYQMIVNGPSPKALTDFQIVSIQGKLSGYGIEEQLPTIAIVAHYDSFGIAPSLAQGADSNGSGVASLLELVRLFSKLYTNSRTHAKFNMLFLLSGGGKFNYQGSRKWIEDSVDFAETALLADVAYVLCLDTIGAEDSLYLHVSKPPKEGSAGDMFVKNMQDVIEAFYPDVKFEIVHKKINLADDLLAWEHERFSIRRLPAFTLSHVNSPASLLRTTVADTRKGVDIDRLSRNTKLIAEALARHVYNLSQDGETEVFRDALAVQPNLISSWMDLLSSQSRAAQLIHKNHPLLAMFEQTMSHHLKDVKRSVVTADKRDPEFLFYDGTEFTMHAYNVKPAVFDLFLALAIAAYLGLVWVLVQNFHVITRALPRMSKAKAQ